MQTSRRQLPGSNDVKERHQLLCYFIFIFMTITAVELPVLVIILSTIFILDLIFMLLRRILFAIAISTTLFDMATRACALAVLVISLVLEEGLHRTKMEVLSSALGGWILEQRNSDYLSRPMCCSAPR